MPAFPRALGKGAGGAARASSVGKFHEFRGVFLLAVAALTVWVLSSFLLPLAIGAIFAVVLSPLMRRLEPKIPSTSARAGLVTAGFIVAFLVPIGVIGALGTNAALDALHSLQSNGSGLPSLGPSALLQRLGLGGLLEGASDWLPASEEQIRAYAIRALESTGAMITRSLQSAIADLPGAIFANVVVVFAIYCFLADGRRAVEFLRKNSFFSARSTDAIFAAVASVCQSTIVATLVTGLVQATLVAIACLVAGAPKTLLIAMITFMASFLPVVGTAPVTIGLAIWGFASGDPTAGVVFLVTIAVVGVSDNLVRPLVLKGGAEMHPLVAFVAAFGGLNAMGFYGLFVGPVIAGLFFAALPVALRSYSKSAAARARS